MADNEATAPGGRRYEEFPPLTQEEEAAFLSWAQAHQKGFRPQKPHTDIDDEEEIEIDETEGGPPRRPQKDSLASYHSTHSHPRPRHSSIQSTSGVSHRSAMTASHRSHPSSSATESRSPSRTPHSLTRLSPLTGTRARHRSPSHQLRDVKSGQPLEIKDRRWLAAQHDIAASNAQLLGRLLAIGAGSRSLYDASHGQRRSEGTGDMRRQFTWSDAFTAELMKGRQQIQRQAHQYQRRRKELKLEQENIRIQQRLQATTHTKAIDPKEMAKTFERHLKYRELRSHYRAAVNGGCGSWGAPNRMRDARSDASHDSIDSSPSRGEPAPSTKYFARQQAERLLGQAQGEVIEEDGEGAGPTIDPSLIEEEQFQPQESKEQYSPSSSSSSSPTHARSRSKKFEPLIAMGQRSAALTPTGIQQLMESILFGNELKERPSHHTPESSSQSSTASRSRLSPLSHPTNPIQSQSRSSASQSQSRFRSQSRSRSRSSSQRRSRSIARLRASASQPQLSSSLLCGLGTINGQFRTSTSPTRSATHSATSKRTSLGGANPTTHAHRSEGGVTSKRTLAPLNHAPQVASNGKQEKSKPKKTTLDSERMSLLAMIHHHQAGQELTRESELRSDAAPSSHSPDDSSRSQSVQGEQGVDETSTRPHAVDPNKSDANSSAPTSTLSHGEKSAFHAAIDLMADEYEEETGESESEFDETKPGVTSLSVKALAQFMRPINASNKEFTDEEEKAVA